MTRETTFLRLPLIDLRDAATAERFAPDYESLRNQAEILSRSQLARKALKALREARQPDGIFRRDMVAS